MNGPPRRYAGRGALSNPPGRFDAQQVSAVDDGWYLDAEPDSLLTTLEPERARSIISSNDSPDVPFERSINPYRGCAHACCYCASGDTPILMASGRTRRLDSLRVGDEIYGTRRVGRYRRFVRSRVLARWSVIKRAYRTTLEDGTTLVTSGDHRFLTDRGWKFVTGTQHGRSRRPHLTTSNRLMGTGAFAAAISRRLDTAGQALKSAARLKVVAIEPLKTMRLYDITTATGDFIANGVVSHNCYARPSHAYMGLSPGLDFETRLFYKQDAAQRLEEELARPGYVCKPITLGANTDPYQPVERRMRVTRSILEVLVRTRHPVTVVTKSALVLRDLDLLADLARARLASVAVSVTTLDAELKRRMEPRAAAPQARLRVLRELNAAGVPAGVLVAPVIPALTDQELEDILAAAAAAGARWAGYVLLRLPYEIKQLFTEWLAEHYPRRAAHVMSLIRDMRGGHENDPRFGFRMRGTGPYALLLRSRFKLACRRLSLDSGGREGLNTAHFRPPGRRGGQMRLEL